MHERWAGKRGADGSLQRRAMTRGAGLRVEVCPSLLLSIIEPAAANRRL